jgi:hypothetical protein
MKRLTTNNPINNIMQAVPACLVGCQPINTSGAVCVFKGETIRSAAYYNPNTGEISEGKTAENEAARNKIAPQNTAEAGKGKEFNDSFLDWAKGSVTSDENGIPQVVYHATYSAFKKFSRKFLGEQTNPEFEAIAKLGFYFTPHREGASEWLKKGLEPSGANIRPVYLRLKNPIDYEGEYAFDTLLAKVEEFGGPNKFRKELQEDGYDGIILRGTSDSEFSGNQYVVFSNNQIKSIYNKDIYTTQSSFNPPAAKEGGEVPQKQADGTIRSAAYYNPNTGEISEGKTHAEAASKMKEMFPVIEEGKTIPKGIEEGFVTDTGRFVTNKDAEAIAKTSGQISQDYKLTQEERILGRPTAQNILRACLKTY